jgi:hypothetical protein
MNMPPRAPKSGAGDTVRQEGRSSYGVPSESPVSSLQQGAAPACASKDPIDAELIGEDACVALGLTLRATAPVLEICRALIAAGHDPDRPLHAYRGDTLCLSVRAIGEAARLEINAKGTGFAPLRAVRTAPPVEFTNSTGRSLPPPRRTAPGGRP